MAHKGYWAVCEDVYLEDGKAPSACLVRVDGFYNADVMGETRLEAFIRAKRKLIDNINFLYQCRYEMPALSTSDTPPEHHYDNGAVLMFIPLKEIGVDEGMIEESRSLVA